MNLNPYRVVSDWFRNGAYREAVRAGSAAAAVIIILALTLAALDTGR